MNIYQISKKIWFFILLFLGDIPFCSLFASTHDFSGLPHIQNFPASVITQRDNNQSIVKDSRDFIYVANTNGILEFDGFTWRTFKITGLPVLAQSPTGQVAFAAFNRLGVIEKSTDGTNQFRTLVDSSLLHSGQIVSLVVNKHSYYFSTENEAFLFSESEGITKIFSGSALRLLQCGKQCIVVSETGSYLIDERSKSVSLIQRNRFTAGYYSHSSNCLIANDSLFIFSNNWELTEAKQLPISETTVLSAQLLNDGTLVLGTQTQGMFFLSEDLSEIKQLSTQNGLMHDRVNGLLCDGYGNVWSALGSGIARIETPSAYSFYNKNNGIEGKVNSVISYQARIYASTTSGTFSLTNTQSGNAEKVFRSTNVLFQNNGVLYAGTENGLYADILTEPKKLFSGNVTEAYVPSNQSLICFIATGNEVRACRLERDACQVIKTFGPFPDRIQSMAYDENGSLWLGTKYSGLFVAHGKNGIMGDEHSVGKGAGLPNASQWVEVLATSKGTLFSTSAGVYRYDYELERFYKDKLIQLPVGKEHSRIYPIVEDADENLWLGIGGVDDFSRQIAVAWNVAGKDKYTLINQPFAKSSDFVSDVIFPDKNFVVWFGGYDGMMRLDFKKIRRDSLSNKTFIRSVHVGDDSLICESPEFLRKYKQAPLDLAPNVRSIHFSFVSPYYTSKTEVKYQYRLEGLDMKWSELTTLNEKSYDRLPKGTYTFRVRALDELGNYSESASLAFSVNDPFYRSIFSLVVYAVFILFVLIIFRRWRLYQFAKEKLRLEEIISSRTEDLLLEKEKTERLLSNILPERTVKELKDKGRAKSMRFDMVTVLFSDIQGFTRIAEQMNPDCLVDELDKFFLQFDGIVDQFNIEKIKTIGDAYMCAGGLPQKNRTNPLEVIIAALEIQYYIRQMQEQAGLEGKEYWGLRIGIHTGPVVAGVIGSKKFTYDIWGDTVNIASRMESSGEVGRVNISEDTYLLVNEYFDCEYRGRMPVKYKGEIAMYFVNGFLPELSADSTGVRPNKIFLDKLALLKYQDLEDFVLDRMEKELPHNFYYHNIRHTIDVAVSVEVIAIGEGVADEEMLALKVAALFHDSGFLIDYHDHEHLSIQFASEILPKFGYGQDFIRLVGDLIYATRLPANPKNKLEEIICDADLDYLGRSDYIPVSQDLYRELQDMGLLKKNEYEWTKLQIKFLQGHKYFTDTSKALRNNGKNRQLRTLLKQDHSQHEDSAVSVNIENS